MIRVYFFFLSLFWVGAYYYYRPEVNKTLEETLIDVKLYANKEGIPYRWVMDDLCYQVF